MPNLRLLASSLLFAACAAPAVAQTAPLRPAPAAPVTQMSVTPPQAGLAGRSLSAIASAPTIVSAPTIMAHLIAPTPNNGVCYTIRSYDFVRDDPDSDATRLTGSTTCLPSSKLKLKSATAPRGRMFR